MATRLPAVENREALVQLINDVGLQDLKLETSVDDGILFLVRLFLRDGREFTLEQDLGIQLVTIEGGLRVQQEHEGGLVACFQEDPEDAAQRASPEDGGVAGDDGGG